MAVQERTVAAGDYVYREGEPGDAVFVVTAGRVEVLRAGAGETLQLTVLGKGAIFGEMGVIRNQPRSTSTRALDDATLLEIPAAAFLATFDHDNPLGLPLLRTLCERLGEADRKLVRMGGFSEPARSDAVARIRLLPASREIEAQIGTEGVTVGALPFHVGRGDPSGKTPPLSDSGLLLRAAQESQISPLHFAIEEDDGRIVLRDLDSHLGTVVNGARVAHYEYASSADLRFGNNDVQTGGSESPYRFHIIVEKAEDAVAAADEPQR